MTNVYNQIPQRFGEPRVNYLLRIAAAYIIKNNLQDHYVNYDETTCDGYCLIQDIEAEIDL